MTISGARALRCPSDPVAIYFGDPLAVPGPCVEHLVEPSPQPATAARRVFLDHAQRAEFPQFGQDAVPGLERAVDLKRDHRPIVIR